MPSETLEAVEAPPERSTYRKFRFRIIRGILRLVAQGVPPTRAAGVYGVQPNSLSNWKERYVKFENLLARAEQLSVATLCEKVVKHRDRFGVHDWKASAWMLERRFRDEFGPPAQVQVTNQTNVAIGTLFMVPQPQVLENQAQLFDQSQQGVPQVTDAEAKVERNDV